MPFKSTGDFRDRKKSAEERSELHGGFGTSEGLLLAKNFCTENAECI
jgi:hypothetical protein